MTKYFVTGPTGFIGTAVTKELINHGHKVLGLARSDASASKLLSMGAEVIRGQMTDIDILKRGASESDGVLHVGFVADFGDMASYLEIELNAIKAFESALEGTNKPLIMATGSLGLAIPRDAEPHDEMYTENTLGPIFGKRIEHENYVLGLKKKSIRAMSIRCSPSVHGEGDHQFVPFILKQFLAKGYAFYPGDGENLWTAVSRQDTASLFRLAAESGAAGQAYHACGEWISVKQIAEALAKKYCLEVKSIPIEEAGDYFGFLVPFITFHAPVKTEITRKTLGWNPVGPTLAEDIEKYY